MTFQNLPPPKMACYFRRWPVQDSVVFSPFWQNRGTNPFPEFSNGRWPCWCHTHGDAETMSTCQPGCRAMAIFGQYWPLLAIIDHYWIPGGRAIANIPSLCIPIKLVFAHFTYMQVIHWQVNPWRKEEMKMEIIYWPSITGWTNILATP